ncbi:MAG: TlyA family RNA methyltransferase [Clostridia bacterium]|nr:TlyA family RNA methyltransferase [Clostridia bacterium]
MAQIRLDKLAARQFGVSEAEAAALIMERRVYMNGAPADKPGTSVPEDTALTLKEKARKYASRSGYKLERALTVFGVDPAGRTVCDIGASNGGFTDCLLQRGAAHVFAVDVAYGILAWELRQDPRVTVLERTNARYLTEESLGTRCDLVTCDVSFISLKKIFPAVRAVLKDGGQCVCLIKPQFEAPARALGKNGVVKDPAILPELFTALADAAAENGLYLRDMTVSPIHGQNGNVEFLAHFTDAPRLTGMQRRMLAEKVARLTPDGDEPV